VTAKTEPTTTSGIPTAKGYLPPGTPARDCIDHNRACKVARIVNAALAAGLTDTITDDAIDALADDATVRRPSGNETRNAVRRALAEPLTGDDCNQDLAQAVLDAVYDGHPFRFRTASGRTVLLLPLPVSE
jgi:hypothetical protein